MARAVEKDEAWGISAVEQYVGVSRISIWRMCKRNAFPAPHYVLRQRKWWKSEVVRWVEQQAKPQFDGATVGGAK